MARKRLNPRLPKMHYSYSVEEIAALFGVHTNTVRSWLKNGLIAIDDARPLLVNGAELRRFIEHQRPSSKKPCLPGTLYCFRCKIPSAPSLGMADFAERERGAGNLEALCDACGTLAVAKALSRFELSTGHLDFKRFHREQAMAFKRKLDAEINPKTGKGLSRSTVHATLQALRAFFIWAADKPGFRRAISYSDAEYFNLPEKEARIAKATREKAAPTIEQIHYVLARMPQSTDIDRRDRALLAFTLLTGTRDGAIASLKLKHIFIDVRRVDQDAREVKTKFLKTFSTWFFPVGGEAQAIIEDWVTHLRGTLLWGNEDPLFPATLMRQSETGGFFAAGLDRKHWSSADPIRRIFSKAFQGAGLASFNPHSFRDTIVRLGEQLCKTPEEFKAWSQNLGHEKVLTTLTSYGVVGRARQAELIVNIGKEREVDPLEDFKQRLARLEARS